MPRLQSLAPLLRPLAAPRAATCHHLRFSTTRLHLEQQTPATPKSSQRTAALAAAEATTESDNAQAPAPKPSLPSKRSNAAVPPSPFSKAKTLKNSSREKKASAAAAAAASSSSSSPDSTTTANTNTTTFRPATHIELPPPSYHISRTLQKNLPIYTEYKRGGNLHLTTIRKVTGDLSALRDELRVFLHKKNEEVRINALTGHVIVKGHCTAQVKEFLEARGL